MFVHHSFLLLEVSQKCTFCNDEVKAWWQVGRHMGSIHSTPPFAPTVDSPPCGPSPVVAHVREGTWTPFTSIMMGAFSLCEWATCKQQTFLMSPTSLLLNTHVLWQIELSQFLAFFSTHIFTLQQLLEDSVKILFHIHHHYAHFWGGSQKCTQGTPPVKARNSQKV